MLHPDSVSIAEAMNMVDLVEDWAKAVRTRASALMHEGFDVPGYKLVRGKKGNRAWVSETEAAALLAPLGDGRYAPRVLLSPAQAEKAMKKVDKSFRIPDTHVSQSEGGLHVAPHGDPRPAVVAGPVADEFDNVAGDEGELV